LRSDGTARVLSSLPVFSRILVLSCLVLGSEMGLWAVSPGLSIVSGNGQVVAQFFNTVLPLTVQARDAAGNPAPNIPLTWTVTPLQGTIPNPPARTDANGMASAYFNGNVTPGYSFSQQTVTVGSSLGSVNFVVTTVINSYNSEPAGMPTVTLTAPPPENRTLTGAAGATLPGAIQILVGVQSGPQQGAPIPNVGFRIIDGEDPNAQPAAQCAAPPLTNSAGIAQCDLVLTAAPGTYSIRAETGEFNESPPIFLTIGAATTCTYSSTATSQQFPAIGGVGTITVTTQSGCSWTATSNSTWITLNAPTGTGYGGTGFIVAANTGAARSGSISVGGQTITINQAASGSTGGGQPLSISTTFLPSGTVGAAYSAVLAASGGTSPYSWAASTLPGGLTLNPSTGTITGTPMTAGSYNITITLTDKTGATQAQTFPLTVLSGGGQSGSTLAITNTGFSNAIVGIAYQQVLTSAGGCTGLFDAPPVFSVTQGALPAGLSITMLDSTRSAITGTPAAAGSASFTLTVTACNQTASSLFTLTVTSVSSSLGSTPASLSYSFGTGQTGNPADQNVTLSGPTGATFSAVPSTTSGGNWLTIVGAPAGTLPATLTVRVVNPGTLAANTYTGSIAVSTGAGSLNIPVTLAVTAPAAALATSMSTINVSVQVGAVAIQQPLTVTNSNAGPVQFTVVTSTVTGGAWLSASAVSGNTPANLMITVNPGGLQAAPYTGTIQLIPVNPAGATLVVPVNLRVLPPPGLTAAPSGLSFNIQAGQPLPPAQSLAITSTGVEVQSTITATTNSGGTWLFVTPPTGLTPFMASVTVNPAGLLPGTYQGTVVVASGVQAVTPLYIPVTMIIPQSGPTITAIVNAASFQQGAVSPGEIVTIFGSALGPSSLVGSHVNAGGALDPMIGATRVLFDGFPAAMIYTSSQQVSAIVPYELYGRTSTTTQVQVEYQSVPSTPVTLNVVPSAPAIFTFSSSGQGPAAALNQDGSYNLQNNGAEPGSIIVLYATGEGQTSPAGVDGLLANSVYPAPLLAVGISFGGENAQVVYAGAAPTLAAGLMQVNAVLPADLPRGSAIPVVLTVGTAQSQQGVTIFTKQ
jgi:uncharacterized protein (TIGR03437 family)